jgi:hypothetical protein
LRIIPWSTKTHVSWSPIARWTSSAATEESTPPERPQMTFLSPPAPDALELLLDDGRGAPRQVALADVAEERPEARPGRTGCAHLGVVLDAVDAALDDSSAATGDAEEDASAVKPGGGAKTVSRCDIQQGCSAGSPASSRPCSVTVSVERPYSPVAALSTRAPRSSAMSCMP